MVARRAADLRGDGAHLSSGPGRVHVIFNPASGRGRGGRRIPAYLDLLRRHLGPFEHSLTAAAGDEGRLARAALESGAETVVAVGGDGTWSQVADQVIGWPSGARLALLPSGTGNDFGRNLGLSFASPEDAVRALAAGRTRRVDVGRVTSPCAPDRDRGRGDAYRARHFLNVVGFGFDIAVIDAAASARFLKGAALYKITALQQLFRYPGIDVTVASPKHGARQGHRLIVVISNGRYFGGGFPIAPDAKVDDGSIHACVIEDGGPFRRAALFNRAERGKHVGAPEVQILSDRSFTVRFSPEEPLPRFEVDGDVYGSATPDVQVEVLPGALEVVVP
ncbi:MAG: diacylglycerol kinase family lipid kinase [Gemmatimonadetes bacterium]|nr:diacylglycerol kinase family lipid kinase [Gemmatimonadota bacterium]